MIWKGDRGRRGGNPFEKHKKQINFSCAEPIWKTEIFAPKEKAVGRHLRISRRFHVQGC